MIPIIIICYNNYKYVDNTVRQILTINESYLPYIHIMNNASTDPATIEYLEHVQVKVIENENNGPRISDTNNKHIYDTLPDKFILTDADLEFNKDLPMNFIEHLVSISDVYNCSKVGFALRIDDFADMYQGIYFNGKTIYDWELPYWWQKDSNINYDLYWAAIDTTFCVINKHGNNLNLRVGGDFTARHLPWYRENSIVSLTEQYKLYTFSGKDDYEYIDNNKDLKYAKYSTMSDLFLDHVNSTYEKEIIDGATVFIPKHQESP